MKRDIDKARRFVARKVKAFAELVRKLGVAIDPYKRRKK